MSKKTRKQNLSREDRVFGNRENSKTLDCIRLDDYYCDDSEYECDDSEYEYFDGGTETHVSESAEDLEDAALEMDQCDSESDVKEDEAAIKYVVDNDTGEIMMVGEKSIVTDENVIPALEMNSTHNSYGSQLWNGINNYDSVDEYYDYSMGVLKAYMALTSKYSFMTLAGQLYMYDQKRGYWKLLPLDNCNRSLRALLTEAQFGRIRKNDLYDLSECIIVRAPKVKEHELEKCKH